MHNRVPGYPDEYDFQNKPVVVAPWAAGRRQPQFPRPLASAFFMESFLQAGAAAIDCCPIVSALHSRHRVASTALDSSPNAMRTPTMAAVATSGNSTAIKWTTALGKYALQIAAGRGHRAFVRALLDCGAEVNATVQPDRHKIPRSLVQGMSALHWAALRGHSSIVEDLIAAGADKNAKVTRSGESPLHLAARRGHHITVGVLLDAGADAAMLSRSNLSPLDLAACNNHPITIEEFMYHGMDPNRANPLGYTAVHQASYHNAVDALEVLIRAGGSLKAVAHDGFTPLHVAGFAASTGAGTFAVIKDKDRRRKGSRPCADSPSAVQTLARHGGDVDVVDTSGSTPLRLACVHKRKRAVADLLSVGANEDLGNLPPSSFVAHNDTAFTATKSEDDAARTLMAMFTGAAADNAWRRRGWLVFLRTRALKYVRQRRGSSIVNDGRMSDILGDFKRVNCSEVITGRCGNSSSRIDRLVSKDDRGHRTKRHALEVGLISRRCDRGFSKYSVHANDGRGVLAGGRSLDGFFEAVMRMVFIEDDKIFRKIASFL